jgi:hypothetical protein
MTSTVLSATWGQKVIVMPRERCRDLVSLGLGESPIPSLGHKQRAHGEP